MRRIVDALYRVHQLISVITDLNTLLERIMEAGKNVARAEACSLLLHDPHTGELYFQVAQGERGDQQALKREVRLKVGEGIAGSAAHTRKSVNVEDVTTDPRFFRAADGITRFTTRSLLAVPMIERERLVGVIEFVNKIGGGAFSETDRHVVEMFSSLAATSIVNARLIEDNLRKERMAAIGQAVAGLAHHAKNIITGMGGSVELLDENLAKGNLDSLRRVWPVFKRSTVRLSDFVQDMLAFSKPREPIYEDCRLAALIDEVVKSYADFITRRKVRVEVLAEADVPMRVDTQGIYRCLQNLLANAVDAAPQDTGVISIRARNASKGCVMIEVADNGPGIPAQNRSKVFEPFFSTKGSQGTGLGLAVTHKIIREHRGEIVAEQAPEGGALFRILLPASETRRSCGEE